MLIEGAAVSRSKQVSGKSVQELNKPTQNRESSSLPERLWGKVAIGQNIPTAPVPFRPLPSESFPSQMLIAAAGALRRARAANGPRFCRMLIEAAGALLRAGAVNDQRLFRMLIEAAAVSRFQQFYPDYRGQPEHLWTQKTFSKLHFIANNLNYIYQGEN